MESYYHSLDQEMEYNNEIFTYADEDFENPDIIEQGNDYGDLPEDNDYEVL
jgi:hypothetical protein